jgi:TolB-like protein/class 3 adenylate cyclase/Tfp pilus assembly protein PilF
MPSHGTELRKLAAIMFTDMVGYSALAQRDETLAIELLDEHRRILRDVFPKFHGREIETTGDGFLVEFASALEAAECAVKIQRTLTERNKTESPERRILIRIGLHVGDVVIREDHVLGDGVNIAARIEPLAAPGGICISRQVFDQVRNKIPHELVALGQAALKNIAVPVEVFQIFLPGSSPATAAKTASSAPRAGARQKSIAVLPFVNMSVDRENEFLSDGITEDLITALSRINGLHVPARTSAFAFKGRNEDIRHIGGQLNVTTVLEGSVRKAGNRLRITAQLVKVADGFHLWSERYDREMKDVFEIQDEITQSIVAALRIELSNDEDGRRSKRPTANTEAYQLYLKGRDCWNQRGLGLKKALHYFELTQMEDPNYTLAYTGMADSYSLLGFYGYLNPKEAGERGMAAATKALELDPNLAEAHTSMGGLAFFLLRDLPLAEAEYRQAIALNSNYVPARYWYAMYLSALGRAAEAQAEMQRALAIDPLSFLVRTINGWILMNAKEFGSAIVELQKSLELHPGFPLTHSILGQTLAAQGKAAEAGSAFQKAVDFSGRAPWTLATLGYGYALTGQQEQAQQILAELEDRAKQVYLSPWWLAFVHMGLGDYESALGCLERAYEVHDTWLMFTKAHFGFERLRGEKRFQDLLKKIGLEH